MFHHSAVSPGKIGDKVAGRRGWKNVDTRLAADFRLILVSTWKEGFMTQQEDRTERHPDPIAEVRAHLSDTTVLMLVAAARTDPERARSRLQRDIAELSDEIDEARARLTASGATEAQIANALSSAQNFVDIYRRVLEAL